MTKFLSIEEKDQGVIYKVYFGLFDCRKKKTFVAAVGFYVVNLIGFWFLLLVIGFFLEKFFGFSVPSVYKHRNLFSAFNATYVAYTSFSVFRQRRLINNFRNIGLILFSWVITFLFTVIAGMLIPAYLSTQDAKN